MSKPRIEVTRVYLDRQGYTTHGKYFGVGLPVYECYDSAGDGMVYVRAIGAVQARVRAAGHFNIPVYSAS